MNINIIQQHLLGRIGPTQTAYSTGKQCSVLKFSIGYHDIAITSLSINTTVTVEGNH